jgi:signal transduction histidine kinase
VLVGVCLGLSIVKRRLALLEAAQQLRSEPGRGTCFSIALPLAKPMPARPDPDR